MNNHDLLMALANLMAILKGSSVEKYKYFHDHMGVNCPYTRKAAKAFAVRDKDSIMKKVSELIRVVEATEPN